MSWGDTDKLMFELKHLNNSLERIATQLEIDAEERKRARIPLTVNEGLPASIHEKYPPGKFPGYRMQDHQVVNNG